MGLHSVRLPAQRRGRLTDRNPGGDIEEVPVVDHLNCLVSKSVHDDALDRCCVRVCWNTGIRRYLESTGGGDKKESTVIDCCSNRST